MTTKPNNARDGVADAWTGWIHMHPVSTHDAIEDGVKAAFGAWLNGRGEDVIAAAVTKAVAAYLAEHGLPGGEVEP